jgi:biotin carboxyl carrier protein
MRKKLRITFKGQTYDVVAEILDDEAPAAPRTASSASVSPLTPAPVAPAAAVVAPSAPLASGGQGSIPSPIAGKVVSITKPVGSQVASGDVILVLEAMKMNTEVCAPFGGTVKAVKVAPTDSVSEGQELMILE